MPGQAELSWVTDLNGAVTHYNNPARSYLGLTPPDELGWVWWWAIHPVDLPRVRRSVQWAMQQGRPCQVTYRLRRADGQYRPHRSRVIPVLDERGRVGSWRWTAVAGDDPGR
jgi:PAS domain S-box-containing protein